MTQLKRRSSAKHWDLGAENCRISCQVLEHVSVLKCFFFFRSACWFQHTLISHWSETLSDTQIRSIFASRLSCQETTNTRNGRVFNKTENGDPEVQPRARHPTFSSERTKNVVNTTSSLTDNHQACVPQQTFYFLFTKKFNSASNCWALFSAVQSFCFLSLAQKTRHIHQQKSRRQGVRSRFKIHQSRSLSLTTISDCVKLSFLVLSIFGTVGVGKLKFGNIPWLFVCFFLFCFVFFNSRDALLSPENLCGCSFWRCREMCCHAAEKLRTKTSTTEGICLSDICKDPAFSSVGKLAGQKDPAEEREDWWLVRRFAVSGSWCT